MATSSFPLMDLPQELRDMVFGYYIKQTPIRTISDLALNRHQLALTTIQLVSKRFSSDFSKVSEKHAIRHYYIHATVDPRGPKPSALFLPPTTCDSLVFHVHLTVAYEADAYERDGWRWYERNFTQNQATYKGFDDFTTQLMYGISAKQLAVEITSRAVNGATVSFVQRIQFLDRVLVSFGDEPERMGDLRTYSVRCHRTMGVWSTRESGGEVWPEMNILREGEEPHRWDKPGNTAEGCKEFLKSMGVREPQTCDPEDEEMDVEAEGERYYVGSPEGLIGWVDLWLAERFVVTSQDPEKEERRTRRRLESAYGE